MHPQILKDEPGKCPLCVMNLIPVGGTDRPEKDEHSHHHQNHDHHSESDSSAAGFDKHAGHHTPDFLKRFWITLVLSVPVLLLSHMIQQWLGQIQFVGIDRPLYPHFTQTIAGGDEHHVAKTRLGI